VSSWLITRTNQTTSVLDANRKALEIIPVREPVAGIARLGFGLSKLMRIPSRAGRQRLLDSAYDQGIRHFDVARMYGLGASEKELGTLIRSKRTQVTVATKFGLEPTLATRCLSSIQSPVRWFFARFPGLKAAAAEARQPLYRPKRFTPDLLRTSLDTSLRQLGTDYVDILFLHEPMPGDHIANELSDSLKDLQRQGKIRSFGMSSTANSLISLIGPHPGLTSVLQFDNDATGRQIDSLSLLPHSILFTFAPFSMALPVLQSRCEQVPSMVKKFVDRTGVDLRSSQEQIRLLLSYAIHANPQGKVVFASTNVQHIAAVAKQVRSELIGDDTVQLILKELGLFHRNSGVRTGSS
jgi:D-threo-aldose 1-dehydrogenase